MEGERSCSAIRQRRANRESINIKEGKQGRVFL